MQTIAVTGGSGGSGHFVVEELLRHGYACRVLDIQPPRADGVAFRNADLTRYGDAYANLEGCDAVVHFAANPHPDFDHFTGADRFHNNTASTFNVFQAAAALGISRVVWASSETVQGFPFEKNVPASLPVDETHALQPQNAYALAKVVGEKLAEEMARLHGMTIIGLRLSNVLYDNAASHAPYQAIPGYWDDLTIRRANLYGYVDARDVAAFVRLALEAPIKGAENFIVAAQGHIMRQSNAELAAAQFPGVPLAAGIDPHQGLLSIEKARKMLGYKPQYSWRTVLGVES